MRRSRPNSKKTSDDHAPDADRPVQQGSEADPQVGNSGRRLAESKQGKESPSGGSPSSSMTNASPSAAQKMSQPVSMRARVVERMRKRDVTLGMLIGLLAAFLGRSKVQETLPVAISNFSTVLSSLSAEYSEKFLHMPGVNFSMALSFKEHSERPGLVAAQKGLRAVHPLFIIPGFTTTGLEVWEGHPCAKKYFRQRMWGTLTMMRTFMLDKECWVEHLKLHPSTGGDPPGIKLRAAQGLEAVDYVMPGYNVWGRMIESLADIGYDSNNLYSMPYDWRLALPLLETRDGYFTRLKSTLELSLKVHGKKAGVLSHSFGDTVFRYFMSWVEDPDGGGAGPGWVEKHVAEYVCIAGSMLGSPKVLTGLLSGEMRDTAEMQGLQEYLTNAMVPYPLRIDLWRSWGSLLSILPMGGEAIWGNLTYTPDILDTEGAALPLIMERRVSSEEKQARSEKFPNQTLLRIGNKTVEDALELLWEMGGKEFAAKGAQNSYGADYEGKLLHTHTLDPKHWANPLEARLPDAPNLRIYCVYGLGKQTERAYYYTPAQEEQLGDGGGRLKEGECVANAHTGADAASGEYCIDPNATPKMLIDKSVTVHANNISVKSGVVSTEGDATVPLISLGYMCVEGWKKKRFNPAGIKCVTRELEHDPVSMFADFASGQFQGGPNSADHVDIMGNHGLIADVLMIAAGRGSEIPDRIISSIKTIAARVQL